MCALTHDAHSLSRALGGRKEPVSTVVDTHLLFPASGGHTWLTWLTTVPYSSCDTLQQNAVATCCLVAPTMSIKQTWLRSFLESRGMSAILTHILTIHVSRGSRACL